MPKSPPERPGGFNLAEACRYVDFSIRHLARQFDALGADRRDLEVKLFGGADVLPVAGTPRSKPTVGAQNCRAAEEVLAEEGFRVSASDVGGTRGRRIHFHTGTGEVLLHRLGVWSDPRVQTDFASAEDRRITP